MTEFMEDERLIEAMRETLDGLLLVIRSVSDEHRGAFAVGSPAWTSWSGCTDEWSGDLQEAFKSGMTLWVATLDHAQGLSSLITARRTYSLITLSRGLAENAIRAWYLLQDGVDPLERVRRYLNDRLYANHEDQRLFLNQLPETADRPELLIVAKAKEPELRAHVERNDRVETELVERGVHYGLGDIRRQKRTGIPYFGDPRPASAELLGDRLESKMHGASFLRFTASVAHGSLHGQGRMLEMLEYPDGQVAARPLRLSSDDLAPMGWPAVGAWFLTARVLFWQAGWTISGLERAIDRLNKTWVLAATPEMLADVGLSEEA